MRTDLFLCTTLSRPDADGAPVLCDVVVTFDAAMTSPGYRARTYGDPDDCYPAEGAEFDCTFTGAALDGEPGPLTAIETATLRRWFYANPNIAWQAANDNLGWGETGA
jgi:hypothetical protein